MTELTAMPIPDDEAREIIQSDLGNAIDAAIALLERALEAHSER